MATLSTPFTLAHAGRVADRLRDGLNDELDHISENDDGRVTGYGWRDVKRVKDLTDGELSMYVCGLRNVALHLADWWESYDMEGDPLEYRRHGCSTDVIDQDFAGAEGECLQRRHPEMRPFGRLRKFNEAITVIRKFRIQLREAYHECLRPGSSLQSVSDLAFSWQMEGSRDLKAFILKMEYRCENEEQRAAQSRCKAELRAAERFCDRMRHAWSDEITRRSAEVFAR